MKTVQDEGFNMAFNTASDSLSGRWSHTLSPPLLLIPPAVFSCGSCNKSGEKMGGMNGRQKSDRATQYLLNAGECFPADRLDIAKEERLEIKRGTKC